MGLAVASLVLGGIGAAVSVGGAMESANAQAAQANYQAQVAANNQTIANQNAQYALKAGEAQAQTAGMEGRAASGGVRAAEAANGLDVNSGSALDVQASQREANVLNVENVKQNAALQAYGFRTQATSFGAQQTLEKAQAAQASTAGPINAFSSLLGSASSLGSNFANYQLKSGSNATGSLL